MGRKKVKTHATPILTRNGPQRTFKEFRDWLDVNIPKDADKRSCFLFGCAELAQKLDDIQTPDQYSIFGIATSLLAAKTLNEGAFPLLAQGNDQITSCIEAARHYTNHAEGVQGDDYCATDQPSREAILLNWIWVLCSNHVYQGDTVHRVANALILTGLYGFQELAPNSTETDKLFSQKTAAKCAKDYVSCLFALWTLTRHHIIVNRDAMLRGTPNEETLKPVLDEIVKQLSCHLNEPFTSKVFSFAATYSGKALAEAIFLRFPLITVADGRYLASGHPFLKGQMTNKFLPKCLALAREIEGIPDTRYSGFIGDRLEAFLKQLCSYWDPSRGHEDEFEYLTSNGHEKSPDRIVFERRKNDETAVLFECKVKLVKEATHTGASWKALESDLAASFSKSIAQGIKFLYDIHHGIKLDKLTPEKKAVCERLRKVKRVALVGLTPDLPPIFVSKPIRDLLMTKVKERTGDDVFDWFTTQYRHWYWHVLDLEELETFLTLPKRKRMFYYELSRYLKRSRIDVDQSPSGGKLPADFRNYLIWNHGAKSDSDEHRILESIPGLSAVFESQMEEIKKYFFQSPTPT